ncbi:MAG: hypothetical protein KJO82_14300 [Gammaproteobacteria bacterium]|nr:hypothetical protein [Gammaproteobacteria bacterium]NNC77269.1 hypothetical protein [Woeseiaceae bacterium]
MYKKITWAAMALLLTVSAAHADLEPWTDYESSEAVWLLTTIKVKSNMGDAYLEGLRNTWIPGNKVAQELGQIESWSIFRSQFPNSGDFNLLLVVKLAKTEDMAPNKARYDAFMQKFTKKMADETTEYAQKNYPAMREITGDYMLREITIK